MIIMGACVHKFNQIGSDPHKIQFVFPWLKNKFMQVVINQVDQLNQILNMRRKL
jgi:hypothetical protein